MSRADQVYELAPTKKDGTPRKGWSPGTAWLAVTWDETGKRRQFYGSTRAEAERKIGAWRRGETKPRRSTAPSAPSPEPTQSPFIVDWLAAWAQNPKGSKGTRGPRRREDLRGIVARHVAPHWQGKPTADITADDVANLLKRLDDRPPTRENLRRDLRAAFASKGSPLSPDLVPSPVDAADETPEEDEATWRILSRDEWRRLEEAALKSTDPVASAIVVTLELGLRSSEVRALRWCDWERARGVIHVRRAVKRGPTLMSKDEKQAVPIAERRIALLIGKPKTKKSRRAVAVTPMVSGVLERHAKRVQERDEAMTAPNKPPKPLTKDELHQFVQQYEHPDLADDPDLLEEDPALWGAGTDLIWPALGAAGDRQHKYRHRPMDQSRLSKVLNALREAAGIPEFACPHCSNVEHGSTQSSRVSGLCNHCGTKLARLRVHDLRHTNASHLLDLGLPQPVILSRLGWASPAMLTRYAHATEHSKDIAVAKLGAIGGTPDQLLADTPAASQAKKQDAADQAAFAEMQAGNYDEPGEDALTVLSDDDDPS